MDPYLEARWSDVHVKLITYISEMLQPVLPRDLRARSEERVLLETTDGEERVAEYRSDVAVVDTGRGVRGGGSGGFATVEPVIVEVVGAPPYDRSVQIIDVTNGNRVVTAIEVLSPWNKRAGRLNADYLGKLEDYARGGVSVVEIDLLRSPGRERLPVGQEDLPSDRRAAYLTCVRRAWVPGRWEVYPMPLRAPLPRVPVPLRRADGEVGLDLQTLIERVYVAGGHDDIDYGKACVPALEGADGEWARGVVG